MHAENSSRRGAVVNAASDHQLLIAAYADGTIDAADLQRLESLLRNDKDCRQQFIQYLNIDSALSDLAALSDDEFDAMSTVDFEPSFAAVTSQTVTRQTASGKVRRSSWLPVGFIAAIAAAVVLIVAIAWPQPFAEDAPTTQAIMAEVVSHDAAQLVGIERRLQIGDQLELNRIQLTSGTIQLQLDSGVLLDLFAPLDGTFESSMQMSLTEGRLNADVGESGKGFTIVTDHGKIIDLGTRFGIDVNEDDAKVAVFDGEVEIGSNGEDEGSGRLKVLEGEGIYLRRGKRPSRLSAVWLSQDTVSLSTSQPSSIVVDVTDNAKSDSFHRFYGVVAGGMREGTIVYTTYASTPRRDISWQAAAGQAFPTELIGADVVCPFHIDRQEQSLTITLQLANPATVYVMHDRRRKPPKWLKRDFEKTTLAISSGAWRPISPLARGIKPDTAGSIYVTYSIWKRTVETAGAVKLGPPQRDGDQGNNAMYGIAVQAEF